MLEVAIWSPGLQLTHKKTVVDLPKHNGGLGFLSVSPLSSWSVESGDTLTLNPKIYCCWLLIVLKEHWRVLSYANECELSEADRFFSTLYLGAPSGFEFTCCFDA